MKLSIPRAAALIALYGLCAALPVRADTAPATPSAAAKQQALEQQVAALKAQVAALQAQVALQKSLPLPSLPRFLGEKADGFSLWTVESERERTRKLEELLGQLTPGNRPAPPVRVSPPPALRAAPPSSVPPGAQGFDFNGITVYLLPVHFAAPQ